MKQIDVKVWFETLPGFPRRAAGPFPQTEQKENESALSAKFGWCFSEDGRRANNVAFKSWTLVGIRHMTNKFADDQWEGEGNWFTSAGTELAALVKHYQVDIAIGKSMALSAGTLKVQLIDWLYQYSKATDWQLYARYIQILRLSGDDLSDVYKQASEAAHNGHESELDSLFKSIGQRRHQPIAETRASVSLVESDILTETRAAPRYFPDSLFIRWQVVNGLMPRATFFYNSAIGASTYATDNDATVEQLLTYITRDRYSYVVQGQTSWEPPQRQGDATIRVSYDGNDLVRLKVKSDKWAFDGYDRLCVEREGDNPMRVDPAADIAAYHTQYGVHEIRSFLWVWLPMYDRNAYYIDARMGHQDNILFEDVDDEYRQVDLFSPVNSEAISVYSRDTPAFDDTGNGGVFHETTGNCLGTSSSLVYETNYLDKLPRRGLAQAGDLPFQADHVFKPIYIGCINKPDK